MSETFESLKPKKKHSLTVKIDEEILKQVKKEVKRRGLKLREVVEHGLKIFLEEK